MFYATNHGMIRGGVWATACFVLAVLPDIVHRFT